MPYGEHFGCDYCGLLLEHADDCPVRLWRQQTDPAPSNLRPQPLAEGTVRGMDAVVLARAMMADQGKTWESIPASDKTALVQTIVQVVCGAERVGWRFRRPDAMLALRDAPFLLPTHAQLRAIAEAIPEYPRLHGYHQAVLRATVCAIFSVLSQHGWGVIAPDGRRPVQEGGIRGQV